MKQAKVFLAFMMALVLIVGMVGCSTSGETTSTTAVTTTTANDGEASETTAAPETEPGNIPGDINGDGKVVISYNNMQETEDFFRVVKASLEEAVAAEGWEMLYAFAERDPQRMRSNIDSFVLQKADFVIDFNVVPEAGSAIASDLNEKGIPMLSIDCVYEDAYFFGVNNQIAGETAGEYLVSKINEKWNGELDYILHIYDESSGPEVRKRNSGAGDAIRAAFPDFDPANEIWQDVSDSDPTDAKNVITDFLTAHPEAKHIAVVSFTDDRAYAALSGVEATGRMNDVMIVSHNADATAVEHMKTSSEDAWMGTTHYNSGLYGEKVVEVLKKIFNGEEVEQMNYNTITSVDRSNVNEYFPD